MDILSIKAVLSWCEQGHFSLNFASHGITPPAPITIRVKDPYRIQRDRKNGGRTFVCLFVLRHSGAGRGLSVIEMNVA